jgi:hypothetical protein
MTDTEVLVVEAQQKLIQTELQRRILAHQAAVAASRALGAGVAAPLNLIGLGDSWFDYPLPIFSPSDILHQLPSLLSLPQDDIL